MPFAQPRTQHDPGSQHEPGSVPAYDAHLDNGWEAQRRLLREADVRVIFDCGANDGLARRRYRAMFPSAEIWSFEPARETFDALAQATGAAERRTLVHAAISDREGEAELNHAENSWADSLVRRPEPGRRAGGVERVRTVTIDAFCALRGIERLDVLKLDVEGVECEAIRGAAATLREKRPPLVFCELNFKPRHPGQSRASQVIEQFWALGYRVFDFYNVARPDPALGLGWLDAVFLPVEAHPAFDHARV